jgi:hypothetical protein
MGFIFCPKCAQSVDDAMDECPYCGTPRPKDTSPVIPQQTLIALETNQPAQPPFFAVSLLKLAVLSTCTFGFYEVYWFWRNWNRIRASGEPRITPSLRAFFLIIFCYSCFVRIKKAGVSRGITPAPPIGILAICYILSAISWKLPGPLSLIAFLSVVFLLPIQSYVNRINAADMPGHDPNSRFGAWNWIATAAGSILLISAVIGSFLPNSSR